MSTLGKLSDIKKTFYIDYLLSNKDTLSEESLITDW